MQLFWIRSSACDCFWNQWKGSEFDKSVVLIISTKSRSPSSNNLRVETTEQTDKHVHIRIRVDVDTCTSLPKISSFKVYVFFTFFREEVWQSSKISNFVFTPLRCLKTMSPHIFHNRFDEQRDDTGECQRSSSLLPLHISFCIVLFFWALHFYKLSKHQSIPITETSIRIFRCFPSFVSSAILSIRSPPFSLPFFQLPKWMDIVVRCICMLYWFCTLSSNHIYKWHSRFRFRSHRAA